MGMISRIVVMRMSYSLALGGFDIVTMSILMRMISYRCIFEGSEVTDFRRFCMGKGARGRCKQHQQSEQCPINFKAA